MKALLAGLLSLILIACVPVSQDSHIKTSFWQARAATKMVQIGELGSCSGVVIDIGKVLTAAHCDAGDGVVMEVDGKKATKIKKDVERDLMLLDADVVCPCLPVASKQPKEDTKVYAIGYPLGMAQVVTEGRVQGPLFYDMSDPQGMQYRMLTTIAVVFGNSGGPVVIVENGQFKLVGIVSAVAIAPIMGFFPSLTSLSFIINTDTVKEFVSPLQR